MKKTYINPIMVAVELQINNNLLTVSGGSNPLDPSQTTDTYDSRSLDFDEEDW